jgi:hypothetical protein
MGDSPKSGEEERVFATKVSALGSEVAAAVVVVEAGSPRSSWLDEDSFPIAAKAATLSMAKGSEWKRQRMETAANGNGNDATK